MPTVYADLAREYHAADPEQRLRLLHREMQRPLITVQKVAALLQQIDPELCQCLPPSISPAEFEHLVQWLSAAGADLQAILDALTPAEIESR
jgi:hypothetical protein